MKRCLLWLALLAFASPVWAQNLPAVCAHRGFWRSDEVPNAQNSIASLRLAQEHQLWGSEFDVHLTADDVVVVHHDDVKNGLSIHRHSYAELAAEPLKNGEVLPTIDMYLDQGAMSPCMLVLEFKPQDNRERADRMVDICFAALKERGLWDPSRVMFISFDIEICKRIAVEAPEFTNQYLSGSLSPMELKELGINGLDYHYSVFGRHPEWVEQAHALGMSVNVWTVDGQKDMRNLAEMGVDCITTNEPLKLLEVLAEMAPAEE